MGKRYFHWDVVDDCVMHETDEHGDTIVEYTREPGEFGPLLSENRGGTESYHHYDALGSTTFLTDAAGNVTDTFAYDAWGNQVSRTGTTPTPYTWVGRWGYQDDTATTGGYYVRARTYQPTVARWMSEDPIEMLYILYPFLYTVNAPPKYIDPSGMDFIAVADRFLAAPAGWFSWHRHYSAEMWSCCSVMPTGTPLGGYTVAQIITMCGTVLSGPGYTPGRAQQQDARELLRRAGFSVWAGHTWEFSDRPGITLTGNEWRVYTFGTQFLINNRTVDPDGISVVMMSNDSRTRILPVFDGDRTDVESRWEGVIRLADNYQWAEHWNANTGVFRNWPNSYYESFGSSSNTFVRHILGNLMVEMDGLHVGAMSPSVNAPPRNWRFTAGQVPFITGSTPPQPAGPPP